MHTPVQQRPTNKVATTAIVAACIARVHFAKKNNSRSKWRHRTPNTAVFRRSCRWLSSHRTGLSRTNHVFRFSGHASFYYMQTLLSASNTAQDRDGYSLFPSPEGETALLCSPDSSPCRRGRTIQGVCGRSLSNGEHDIIYTQIPLRTTQHVHGTRIQGARIYRCHYDPHENPRHTRIPHLTQQLLRTHQLVDVIR